MDAEIHSEKSGDGDFLGYSYLAIPFKIRGDSPAEVEQKVRELDLELQRVLEQFPDVEHLTSVSESIACLSHTLAVAENV
jgi:hypothetical protein